MPRLSKKNIVKWKKICQNGVRVLIFICTIIICTNFGISVDFLSERKVQGRQNNVKKLNLQGYNIDANGN